MKNLLVVLSVAKVIVIVIVFGMMVLENLEAGKAIPFDPNEDCSTTEKNVETAKNAALMACDWIETKGAGIKDNLELAFGMINVRRFCTDNYVWVLDYVEDMTATSHTNYKITLLHPVRPALESNMIQVHRDFGRGYYIIEQQNLAAKLNPEGCWIPYLWTKPGTTETSEKISFIKKCKDKITKKYMQVGAGVHAPHELLKKLNPPQCKPAEEPHPYGVKSN